MTEQEKQKLNEKLARWAGWRQLPQGKQGYHCSYIDGKQVRAMNWLAPQYSDKEWYCSSPIPPRFADSLDACFKCLVPKVWASGFWMQLLGDGILGWDCRIHHLSSNDNYSIYQHKELVPALCLAIEKLIDREANAT